VILLAMIVVRLAAGAAIATGVAYLVGDMLSPPGFLVAILVGCGLAALALDRFDETLAGLVTEFQARRRGRGTETA
jgi:hypothetical protein